MAVKRVGVFKQFKIWGAKDIAVVAVFSGLVFVLTMFAIPCLQEAIGILEM